MAKRSEIEQQIAALQAKLDDADTDDEVWIKEGGREIKVTGRRATSILGRFADLFEDKGDSEGDDADEGDDDADEPPAGGGYFKRRK